MGAGHFPLTTTASAHHGDDELQERVRTLLCQPLRLSRYAAGARLRVFVDHPGACALFNGRGRA